MSFAVLDTLKFAERLEQGGFNEQQARTQANLIAEVVVGQVAGKKDLADVRTELKNDIDAVRTELKHDIDTVRTELKHDIDAVRTELKNDIAEVHHKIDNVRSELKKDIAEAKTSTIQWIVGIVLGAGILQTAITSALILKLLH